jgi:hypothetical protein
MNGKTHEKGPQVVHSSQETHPEGQVGQEFGPASPRQGVLAPHKVTLNPGQISWLKEQGPKYAGIALAVERLKERLLVAERNVELLERTVRDQHRTIGELSAVNRKLRNLKES